MQSVSDSDGDVQKRLLEKPRFDLVAKGVFRLGRCYIFWQGVPGSILGGWKLRSRHQSDGAGLPWTSGWPSPAQRRAYLSMERRHTQGHL